METKQTKKQSSINTKQQTKKHPPITGAGINNNNTQQQHKKKPEQTQAQTANTNITQQTQQPTT